jgi:sulfofructosephosphate aldolase
VSTLHANRATLASLARPSGAMAMVAVDQRESLRTMFSRLKDGRVDDQVLTDFKTAAVEALCHEASALLLDHLYGLPAVDRAVESGGRCGLILALDDLVQAEDGPVTATAIDSSVSPAGARRLGCTAAKLLVLWSPSTEGQCVELAYAFNERCRAAGILSVIEAVVRPGHTPPPASFNREDEIVRAAEALDRTRPDLFKCEVPFLGDAEPDAIRVQSQRISVALDCPWVVLSSGVDAEQFPAAVEHACRGGASGFLAGRAIWADSIGEGDHRSRLLERALPRLRRLGNIVDEHARPWYDVGVR